MQELGIDDALLVNHLVLFSVIIVLLIAILVIQWRYLNTKKLDGLFKKEYRKYYVGRGSTGFIGIHKHSLTIFIDNKTVQKIPFEDLYIYQTNNRFDFKRGPEPLTLHDKTYGMVLSVYDTKSFKKFVKKNNLKLIKTNK